MRLPREAEGRRMRDSEALDELRTADGRRFRVEPIDQPAGVTMPDEFEPRRLARRTLQIVGVFAVVGLVLLLAPGLGAVLVTNVPFLNCS